MDASNIASARKVVVEKPLEEITTWAQWFQEIRDLPEIPSLANLTKKERQAIITEGLAEEYERQHLDVSSQN
jgi:hypothetical protein